MTAPLCTVSQCLMGMILVGVLVGLGQIRWRA